MKKYLALTVFLAMATCSIPLGEDGEYGYLEAGYSPPRNFLAPHKDFYSPTVNQKR